MEAIINTVSTIFKERYGAHLKIERKQKRQNQFGQPQWQSHFVYSRTLRQVSFPIFNSKKELQAVATASPVDNKDAIIFDEMAQFLQLTISEHIELSDKVEQQIETEQAMERAHVDPSKIVQLRTRKKDNMPQFQYKKPEIKRKADLRPIWISGSNETFNAHIAFSIHDWVANWAFINAKEIPDLVWQDPHSWQNFPQVTIFVPDVVSLSENKLQTLKDNLVRLRKLDGPKPLIIVTSPKQISPELEILQSEFRHYQANENVTARVQAHFLLYHHQDDKPWTHHCETTKSLYFLPFSPGPKNFH